MIPAQLVDDLAERLAACHGVDLLALSAMFSGVAERCIEAREPSQRRLALAMAAACEHQWDRLMSGQPYRLDDVTEAVEAMSDSDLREAIEAHRRLFHDDGRLDDRRHRLYECLGQMLRYEASERRRTYRVLGRDASSERVTGWWGCNVGDEA